VAARLDNEHEREGLIMTKLQPSSVTRRRLLSGAGALAAAGWVAGGGGWWLHPRWANAAPGSIKIGIATDITGALAPSGNANWQVVQFAVEQINTGGGIAGMPIELFLEDTASDPKVAVGNVRKLIGEHKVDVVLGGISSAIRQAIKDPIINQGRALYIYPIIYEGGECTKYLYCTGPTPPQGIDGLIPHLINTLGKKRFALPGGDYVAPRGTNRYARKVVEANGGEVVLEEYYPINQTEYSTTVRKIRDGKVDCILNQIVPPGLEPFMKQLHNSGFQKNGGVLCCNFFDDSIINYFPVSEADGLYSCMDYFLTVDDPFSKELQVQYKKKFPDTKYPFTAHAAGIYRGIKFYEAAVKATNGDLAREAVSAALDKAVLAQGPGGGAEMVPGKMHCKMNMYLAVSRVTENKLRFDVIEKYPMADPRQC
jgi:branched-chain amino acid transport system substrate-binding protein